MSLGLIRTNIHHLTSICYIIITIRVSQDTSPLVCGPLHADNCKFRVSEGRRAKDEKCDRRCRPNTCSEMLHGNLTNQSYPADAPTTY